MTKFVLNITGFVLFVTELPNSRFPLTSQSNRQNWWICIWVVVPLSVWLVFLRTFWGLSYDFYRTCSGLSRDFLITYLVLYQGFRRTFSGISPDFLKTLSGVFRNFLRTFSGISPDFLPTFSGLSRDCLRNVEGFLGPSQDFLRSFSGLSKDFSRTLLGLVQDILRAFSGHSLVFLSTFSEPSQHFPRTFSDISQNFQTFHWLPWLCLSKLWLGFPTRDCTFPTNDWMLGKIVVWFVFFLHRMGDFKLDPTQQEFPGLL